MRKELEEALIKDFPDLFRYYLPGEDRPALHFGFECGDGWEPIIREAAAKLEAEIAKIGEPAREHLMSDGGLAANQIKEKFGTLRFYLDGATEAMHKIAEEAEHKSETTCESCGKPGRLRGRRWFYTACDEHVRKWGR